MSGAEPAKVFGWKEIAQALDVATSTAREAADRNKDPLPVEVGHKGVWAYESALRDWMRRQNTPYQKHKELLAARGIKRGGRRAAA